MKKQRKNSGAALITGASGGLGLEFAKLCAGDGYDVVLAARNEAKLTQIKEQLEQTYKVKAYVCPVDLSAVDAAEDVFRFTEDHNLKIEILINNAGFGDAGAFHERDWKKQYEMVQVNIVALMQLTHLYTPGMIDRKKGCIMNLSSVAAFSAGPYMSIYYASKEFVRSFSEAVAEEVRGTGVTVTAVCPGPTATGFEKAADMGEQSSMFQKAASASEVAKIGYRAMKHGKVLCYVGKYTKFMSFGCRLVSRKAARRYATTMNR